ncbi:MAG: DNA gyrase inhibitor YacG [Pseudomonadota bacterium]
MPDRPTPRCPICDADTERRWRPFCSKRCADVDLGKWMTGGYAIPSEDVPDEGDLAAHSPRPEND